MSDPMAVSRKLVAVFAADVEGYSRLMGAHEVGTRDGLTESRVILDGLIGDHRGRIANAARHSVSPEFASAFGSITDMVGLAASSTRSRSTHLRHGLSSLAD